MARLNRDDLFTDPALQGTAFCRALTERFDRWLRQLYVTATGAPDRVALVAVGGYGRAELCPQSDLDVLLIHDGRVDVGRLAEKLWYPIWDEGVKLGHAVFTPKEALRLAADELDTATSLLDARHVAGDAAITAELVAAARAQWTKGASRWLPKLKDALTLRAMSPGEVAFVLEPDLKLGRGGLRDAHVLRWLEVVEPGLLDADRASFEQAHERLLEARVALHRRTGAAGRPAPAAGAGRRGRGPRLHGRRCADGERRHLGPHDRVAGRRGVRPGLAGRIAVPAPPPGAPPRRPAWCCGTARCTSTRRSPPGRSAASSCWTWPAPPPGARCALPAPPSSGSPVPTCSSPIRGRSSCGSGSSSCCAAARPPSR